MIRITVFYPKTEKSWFDMVYYLHHHLPLVRQRLDAFGLIHVDIEEALEGLAPRSPSPYYVIANFTFRSHAEMKKAIALHGYELIHDIAYFTDVKAQLVVGRVLIPETA